MVAKKLGFTLVEVLVVLSVTTLLSTLVFSSYKDSQKRYALVQDAQKLASDIRRAQNMSVSGTETPGKCSRDSSCYGYGVYIEKGSDFYLIYADKDGDSLHSGGDETIETIFLHKMVVVDSVSSPNGKMDIFFKPPAPVTYINGDQGIGVSAGEITLKAEDSSLPSITVTVTSFGLVKTE